MNNWKLKNIQWTNFLYFFLNFSVQILNILTFCRFSLHFRTDTYLGFYIALLFQNCLGYSYFYWYLTILLFYISLYFCVNTFETDIMEIVLELNSMFSGSFKKRLRRAQSQKTKLLLKSLIDLQNDMLK